MLRKTISYGTPYLNVISNPMHWNTRLGYGQEKKTYVPTGCSVEMDTMGWLSLQMDLPLAGFPALIFDMLWNKGPRVSTRGVHRVKIIKSCSSEFITSKYLWGQWMSCSSKTGCELGSIYYCKSKLLLRECTNKCFGIGPRDFAITLITLLFSQIFLTVIKTMFPQVRVLE